MMEGKLVDAEFPEDRASIELITEHDGTHTLEIRIHTRDVMRILDFYDKTKDLVFGNLKR